MNQQVEQTQKKLPLRRSGAILLVSCYELGHQPIGIAQPAGFLEQAGYEPAGLDIAVEEFDEQRVRRARFVGISVPMHTALRLGVRVAELIRLINPSCHSCFYGLYASLNADYLLQRVADSVIGGEYETPLIKLVQALENGQEIGDIEGVSRLSRTVAPVLKRPPSSFPVPSRSLLPRLDKYAHLEYKGDQYLVGYVEASRGCLHHCLHCPIVPVYEGRFFVFPEEVVLEDIRRQVQSGATHITFGDPDFLNGPGHSMGIVHAMHTEFPHVTFDFTAKIEHLLKHHALFPELGALGCIFVISAVESFSDLVLAKLEKGHTRADVITALYVVRTAGITLRPSFVAFTPWTSLEDYLELFDIVEANDLIDAIDPVQYSVRLLIPPGSALLAQSGIQRFLGPLDQAGFQHQWRHPDERMDRLHRMVSAAVEQASLTGEDPAITFDRLRALAYQVADREPVVAGSSTSPSVKRRRPPRLTEPWFCCAEPTVGQVRPLHTKGDREI
ncbi:MAG TPA: CUAEP/CCAEP-tail radical SAM protein [Nitrospiraceae bacterium]|nr:CUAEP/CCAEP-tail radical SAM protein [Nitrospiraceae bacterium]